MLIGCEINGDVNVHIGEIGRSEFLYYLNAVWGIIFIVIISKQLEKWNCLIGRAICKIGKRTLGIMCIHASLIFLLTAIIKGNSILNKCIIFGITVLLSYAVAVIYDNIYNYAKCKLYSLINEVLKSEGKR